MLSMSWFKVLTPCMSFMTPAKTGQKASIIQHMIKLTEGEVHGHPIGIVHVVCDGGHEVVHFTLAALSAMVVVLNMEDVLQKKN